MKLERVFLWSDPLRRVPVALRYVLATAVVLMFFAFRKMMGPLMGGYPFLLFFPAIILISVLLDRGTGVFSVFLSAALAWYFFIPKIDSFVMTDLTAAVPLALYVAIGLFVALLVEVLRSTALRLAHTAANLEHSNAINQALLIDVNHRVKNHLASISGLLRLSGRKVEDPQAKEALENAIGRINVLGQVYARLHLGERATVVSAQDFLVSLCDDLRNSILGIRPIALRANIADVPLSSIQAVPIGLIVNELVENALKYAFPSERSGDICVSLELVGETLVLSVQDDGVGFDPATSQPGGGSRIIGSLVQQLGGRLERHGPPGAEVVITLPREAPEG